LRTGLPFVGTAADADAHRVFQRAAVELAGAEARGVPQGQRGELVRLL
jgi:hypothetical protein